MAFGNFQISLEGDGRITASIGERRISTVDCTCERQWLKISANIHKNSGPEKEAGQYCLSLSVQALSNPLTGLVDTTPEESLSKQLIEFDIITDQQLHEEGVEAISSYAMLMTGSHPEYHTTETLNALQHYRDSGGHLSYLGGNGFYWRIARHPEHPDTLEIRRAEAGILAWAAETGEYYHAFDGQYGGLWRRNGRAPQALAGVGFSAQGQFNGSYYRRCNTDPAYDWVFKDIKGDIIGDFGLSGNGAAGFELDRANARLGTLGDAVVLASSEAHSDDFMLVPEEMLTHITTLPGPPAEELIRADIIWYDVPGGGSVFSVGSITFCGSLPCNNFDNSVSQLLKNVVDRVIHTPAPDTPATG